MLEQARTQAQLQLLLVVKEVFIDVGPELS
jgi:hypothetical protein